MNSKFVIAALVGLLALIVFLYMAQSEKAKVQPLATSDAALVLPQLSDADYAWIAARIFKNETGGYSRLLTYWGAGEDFPSFGVGHFIWFPTDVDAPFDETFPAMAAYVAEQGAPLPAWMQPLDPFDAPWSSKEDFDASWPTADMAELRAWLKRSAHLQARFIVEAFQRRWQKLDLPAEQKSRLTALMQTMVGSAQGLFAVIDYFNFKGLGDNPRERYQQQGWGLVQVLDALPSSTDEEQNLVDLFRDSAASRLSLRVELAPKERAEKRWLEGWLARLDGYLESDSTANIGSGFRVQPYIQNPAETGMTILWFSHEERPGQLLIWEQKGGNNDNGELIESTPLLATSLAYHSAEHCAGADCSLADLPYRHELRLTDLKPGTAYRYQVTQGQDLAGGIFSTTPHENEPLRFIVYADSETEPESSGKFAHWPILGEPTRKRRYLVDQSVGYAQNLSVIQERAPAFVAIAGDLVQSGGEQRDWDEFWKQNAALSASTVIVPALGNHDYFGGPGRMGKYDTPDSERAVRKYKTYFDVPLNNSLNKEHAERYYALEYGPVTILVLDTTDGFPHRSEQDTNWRLIGENDGGVAPDWQPGSAQYRWLEKALGEARQNKRFTFVMFHGAPYTSGVHGRAAGDGNRQDILSALPIQALTPLFMRYGVDAVFNGHDEMYEHSVVTGMEQVPGQSDREHAIHFYDIGIGGDGLRGSVDDVVNKHRVFLAHTDAAEVYSDNGVLLEGGKHYGHLEINITSAADGKWQADLDAVYIFPLLDVDGRILGFERRIYDDSVSLMTD